MPHQIFEESLIQVTRGSCFNLALIQPDRKLSKSSFT